MAWFREGVQLRTGAGDSPNSAEVLRDGTLVLRQLDNRAAGRYACRLETGIGSVQSRQAELTVEEGEQQPRITHRPRTATVTIGSRIVLDCLASGYPPPTHSWYKDGGRLSPAHNRFSQAANGSLVIDNAQLDDRCQVDIC